MDADTISAGVLHDTLEDTDTTYEELSRLFGKAVADMVEGETKIASIKTMSKSVQEAETIRKMFFAMSEDIRHHHQACRQAAQHADASPSEE